MRLLALLLACATLSAQSGANIYSVEKEKALGAQLAAKYRRQARIQDAPAVNAYLDELGGRLAVQAPATGFTYTFELTDDEQTWLHEPATFPGGHVFVPASLIMAAADEDELAAMLAHAIAHIVTRPLTLQSTSSQTANNSTVPLIMMGGWSGNATQDNAVPVAFREAQRRKELESDRVAVDILFSARYDPQALARYIERVQPADPPQPNAKAPYPGKEQRLAALQAAIRLLPPATYSPHPGLDAIHRDVTRLTARPAKTPPRLAR
jgi:predicted Zn-dependent protease